MTLRARILTLVALALAPAVAWCQPTPGSGLAGTAHDFTPATNTATTQPVGLCTFCHTPHRALATQLLWNHTLSISNFSWDVPTTTAGTNYARFTGDTYKGPTAKCLSCHDGTVAVGNIAWYKEGNPGILNPTQHAWPDAFNVGATDNSPGAMKGNHPVAMPYPYGNAANTYNGSTTGAGATLTEWQSAPLANIRVFNDDGSGNISAGAVPGKTGIECSSCHDPHNKASVDDLFLRGTISGSDTNYLCLKCHIK
jgi:doubled CXXCH motif protein